MIENIKIKAPSFMHMFHVECDSKSSVGLHGLPRMWEDILLSSGLPKEEILKNPDVILGILSKLENFPIDRVHRNPFPPKLEPAALPFLEEKPFFENWKNNVVMGINLDEWYPVRTEVGEDDDGILYVTTKKSPRNSKNLIALKGFRYSNNPDDYKKSDEYDFELTLRDQESILNEIMTMKLCRSCSQIVYFIDAYLIRSSTKAMQNGTCKTPLFIATEYLPGGTLADLLEANPPLPDAVTAYIMREMLYGLEFLHRNHRIHRDIRSRSVLLSLEGDVKLAHFGLCAKLTHCEEQRKTVCGSGIWMSPEMVTLQGYTDSTDVWSLGITAIECAEGEPPYRAQRFLRYLYKVESQLPTALKKPKEHSALLVNFLACCLQVDPEKRWSAHKLLTHPFIMLACRKEELIPMIQASRAKTGIHDGF